MNAKRIGLVSALVMGLAWAAAQAAGHIEADAELLEVSLTAVVTEVDPASRQVVLRGEGGDLSTVKVDESIARFDEIAVGDTVQASYWIFLGAEFRSPTPEEEAVPLAAVALGAEAIEGLPPGVTLGAAVRAVVTVELINSWANVVTVRGPAGNYVSIPVSNREILQQLSIDQRVILTYAEALAVELEKLAD